MVKLVMQVLIYVHKTKKSTGKLVWICVWEERRGVSSRS